MMGWTDVPLCSSFYVYVSSDFDLNGGIRLTGTDLTTGVLFSIVCGLVEKRWTMLGLAIIGRAFWIARIAGVLNILKVAFQGVCVEWRV